MSEPSLAPGPTLQKLLLVDDHTVVREGLKRLLEPLAGEWRVTEASSGYQALECLRTQPCALAIVDLSLPGMSGLDLIARIRSEFPTVAVLVLTMHAEEQYALRAFQAGARGYVTKDSAAADLVAAVRKVAQRGVFVSAHLAERVVQQLSGQRPASPTGRSCSPTPAVRMAPPSPSRRSRSCSPLPTGCRPSFGHRTNTSMWQSR